MNKQKRNGAFTLIEIMIVIGIMGVILAILLPAIGTKKSANIQATAQSVVSLYTASNSWLSNHGVQNYTGLDIDVLITENLVPGGFDGTNIFGGSFTVDPSAADATALVITATSVPEYAGQPIADKLEVNASTAAYDSGTKVLTVTY